MTNPMLAELDEVVPEGYALVPINPSAQMLDAAVYAQEPNMGSNRGGSNNVNRLRRRAQRVYAVMLKVAAHEQEVALSSPGAAQGKAVELETGAETESTQGRSRAELIATLADMAKRLEAAERKLSRLTGMRNEWERDAREHLMTFGQHLPASVECLVERFDAAIDATQEGEG